MFKAVLKKSRDSGKNCKKDAGMNSLFEDVAGFPHSHTNLEILGCFKIVIYRPEKVIEINRSISWKYISASHFLF